MKPFIVYLRVSTDKQEHGKDAQLASAESYVKGVGGKIINQFAENASGKNDNRVQLKLAIEACKEVGATLLIAKLDRLSRNAAFLFNLKDQLSAANVEVIAADMPEVLSNTLMLSVMAGMAQHEREIIGKRTRDGLKAAKAKGVTLGRKKGFRESDETKEKRRKTWASKTTPLDPLTIHIIKECKSNNLNLNETTARLRDAGIKAPRGGDLTPPQVSRLLNKFTKQISKGE